MFFFWNLLVLQFQEIIFIVKKINWAEKSMTSKNLSLPQLAIKKDVITLLLYIYLAS